MVEVVLSHMDNKPASKDPNNIQAHDVSGRSLYRTHRHHMIATIVRLNLADSVAPALYRTVSQS